MAQKNNKTCIVCSKKYSYCPTCNEDRNKMPWHNIYCSENCKIIFEVASDYLAEALDRKEAKDKLAKCDLSKKNNFHAKIAEAVDKIFSTNKAEIKTEKTDNANNTTLPKMKKSNFVKE